jgi:hypothetical protein
MKTRYPVSGCSQSLRNRLKILVRGLLALILLQGTSSALCAYDFPLAETAIRDAHFLGVQQGNHGGDVLRPYTRSFPGLKVQEFVSFVRLETPFYQVADYASGKIPCYKPDAPPNSVKLSVLQNRKEILPDSTGRSPFFPPTDAYIRLPTIGEYVDLEFKPEKFDSSTLTIVVDMPDGQHSQTEFDMQKIR